MQCSASHGVHCARIAGQANLVVEDNLGLIAKAMLVERTQNAGR